MAYLRCDSCGAKALVAASRCPKCAREFHLVDGRGDRVKLSQCRGCGIMQRRGAPCHWCPPKAETSWRSSRVIQSAAATLLVGVIGASGWSYGSRVQDVVAQRLTAGRSAIASSAVTRQSVPVQPATIPEAESAALPTAETATADAQPSMVASVSTAGVIDQPVVDSSRWVPVVARTWVNIRSGAGRSGDVVGVIKPASRAMLGTTGRAGWRQVRSGDTTGWVDSRLFEADSLGSRG